MFLLLDFFREVSMVGEVSSVVSVRMLLVESFGFRSIMGTTSLLYYSSRFADFNCFRLVLELSYKTLL